MLETHLLTPADIPAARRLSDQANWNHLDADWLRLISLWPETCLAGWLDGKLISTVTLATFGSPRSSAGHLGWIGVMLVDSAHRGAGHGGVMFDAALKVGRERGVTNIGLDATDMGRPLYAKRGLKDLFTMHRWTCAAPKANAQPQREATIRPATAGDWRQLAALDEQAVNLDRSGLLRWIAGERGAQTLVAEEKGGPIGFAMLRLGRVASYIGPLIARDAPTAEALLSAALGAHDNPQMPLFIDTAAKTPLEPALTAAGFVPARTLIRMGLAPADHVMAYGPRVFAIAGLELC